MIINRILKALLVIFCIVFLTLQLKEYELYAAGIRVVLVILLTILYCNRVKNKNKYFFLFLLTFSIGQLLDFGTQLMPADAFIAGSIDYGYFICNGLYILSYIFLMVSMLQKMNFRKMISKFPIHIIVLIALDIFCVIIVTDTTEGMLTIYEYGLEFLYNTVVMVLLSIALINYIDKEDLKSMNLLVGSIFILFSEIIQSAYFYIAADKNMLNVVSSALLVFAFLFFYLQSLLKYSPKVLLLFEEEAQD